VIYLALPTDFVDQNPFASMFNFEYTQDQAKLVIDAARTITLNAKEQIVAAINAWRALPAV
jgi:hypothetical protein